MPFPARREGCQDFERNASAKFDMFGFEDNSHSAAPDLANETVVRKYWERISRSRQERPTRLSRSAIFLALYRFDPSSDAQCLANFPFQCWMFLNIAFDTRILASSKSIGKILKHQVD